MSETPIDKKYILITPKWGWGILITLCTVFVGGIKHLEDVIYEGRVDRIEYEASMKITNAAIAIGVRDIADLKGFRDAVIGNNKYIKPDEVGKRKNKHDQN